MKNFIVFVALCMAIPLQASTVLYNNTIIAVDDVLPDPNDLWVQPTDLTRVNGFSLKPEGACLDDICVPLKQDEDSSLKDWVMNGAKSKFAQGNAIPDLVRSNEQNLAEANFKLGVYFFKEGNMTAANKYWTVAEKLNPDSWNYHRQDWSFTPEQAGANWMKKFSALEGKSYYRPIDGLDD